MKLFMGGIGRQSMGATPGKFAGTPLGRPVNIILVGCNDAWICMESFPFSDRF
jgi:hypothetical protein